MGQECRVPVPQPHRPDHQMNQSSSGALKGGAARSSRYHEKALEEIHNSLQPFVKPSGDSSAASTVSSTSGVSSLSSASNGPPSSCSSAQLDREQMHALKQSLNQLLLLGYSEDTSFRALKQGNGRFEEAIQLLAKQQQQQQQDGNNRIIENGLSGKTLAKLIRKPSLERELSLHRGSPAATLDSGAGSSRSDSPRDSHHAPLVRQYSPAEPPPPLPPPRCTSTPPPPPPPTYPAGMQQLLKRMSPAPTPSAVQSPAPRGTSPVHAKPMIVQNGPQAQQQLTQQMQALNLCGGNGEPPPPYPLVPPTASIAPPSYSASIQSRQSPTQDYRKSPSSGVYSGPTSAGSPSPITVSPVARPTPLQAWSARQTKTQPPIIMQSVKSTQVQKPVLQTAIAPTVPPATPPSPAPPPPSYASSIQQKQQQQQRSPSVPTTEPPSYASTIASKQALATSRCHPLPPPPYNGGSDAPPSPQAQQNGGSNGSGGSNGDKCKKIQHQSPIPERKHMSKEAEEERRECKVQNYSPQAYKFFMEQHIENVIKSHKQRVYRRLQLETEMAKIGLSHEAQCQMRKMLSQKESNYIRLKRAKMDKSMFTKIKPIGVGAFGEVALVRKIDTNHLYAMKTLRKADVLKRNQVAHVKAERDILAEADNEWVVKLYYSFQDRDNLYFVMDYIPGGDLMSLLIKLGIFEEALARFYIAELTCAVESVHKMGFIHRDIKPDNILIDRDGHIKLTDFGLCTGFRWTHNSKYYQQQNGDHNRQDSMDPRDEWPANGENGECRCNHQSQLLKPLERRRRREHARCLAHSLVGTPNYIAPEVLQRIGYTQLCDWWSVGVILYEMLVGSPPFLAGTPAETQYKVINWEKTLHVPPAANLSRDSKDLILKLCVGADHRLGKNAGEVKAHPFFRNVDFDKGLRRQVAPHIPRIEYPTDTSNFDPVDPEKLRNSGSDGGTPDDANDVDSGKPFHGFFEFTFRRFFDDGAFANKISLDDNENQGPVYV